MDPEPGSDHLDTLDAALEGRYRIERELGRGGMASVHLAYDVRHDRRVALKVLRPHLAALLGADRFLREIQTTANLQHPHILPLFDSGEAAGFLYYVMPYVEGESLRERLARERQLPVDQAVRIASQVAGALEYAHEMGVVHRDVKPANILLSRGGPLVADFGIALALRVAGAERLTETGLSVGTPHYMSPEQAAGDEHLGPATDVWALGCVLYEMLVGERPFTGTTPQAVLGKVLTATIPSARDQRKAVPLHVDATVATALERLPADRFKSAGDFARALADPAYRGASFAAGRHGRSRARAGGILWPAAALLAAGLAVWGWFRTAPISRSDALSFSLPGDQLLPVGNQILDISRDGSRVVYVAQSGTEQRLFVRDLDRYEVRPVAGSVGAERPFLSPDGGRVGFFADGRLKIVPVEGGIVDQVMEARTPSGGSWGTDGTIVVGSGGPSLWRLSPEGGPAREIPLTGDGGRVEGPVRDPYLLPDHTHVLAVARWAAADSDADARVVTVVADLDDGRARPLDGLPDPTGLSSRPRYVRPGYVLTYAGNQTVVATPFDARRRRVTGPPRRLLDDALKPAGSTAVFSASESGTLIYAPAGIDRRLVLVERNGRETLVEGVGPRGYRFPHVSPDGSLVAVTVDPIPSQIWVVDLLRGTERPVSTEGHNLLPAWSPDGTRLAWRQTGDDGTLGVHWVSWPDAEPIHFLDEFGLQGWIGEDLFLVRPADHLDLQVLDVSTGEARDLVAGPGDDARPRLSPDGRWVAYTSDETGVEEIWIVPLDGAGHRRQVSTGGGTEPRWSADGSEIFYRRGSEIWVLEVETSPTFRALGSPRFLFPAPFDFTNGSNWDALPDGRFLMIRGAPDVGREIRVMTGWIG